MSVWGAGFRKSRKLCYRGRIKVSGTALLCTLSKVFGQGVVKNHYFKKIAHENPRKRLCRAREPYNSILNAGV
jgi:hypothetical protein